RPPMSTRFPYTTLFRSSVDLRLQKVWLIRLTEIDELVGRFHSVFGVLDQLAIRFNEPLDGEHVIESCADSIDDTQVLGCCLDFRSEEHTSELQSLRHLV